MFQYWVHFLSSPFLRADQLQIQNLGLIHLISAALSPVLIGVLPQLGFPFLEERFRNAFDRIDTIPHSFHPFLAPVKRILLVLIGRFQIPSFPIGYGDKLFERAGKLCFRVLLGSLTLLK